MSSTVAGAASGGAAQPDPQRARPTKGSSWTTRMRTVYPFPWTTDYLHPMADFTPLPALVGGVLLPLQCVQLLVDVER